MNPRRSARAQKCEIGRFQRLYAETTFSYESFWSMLWSVVSMVPRSASTLELREAV